MLANFGVAVTYETFITLGLILAVPACAGNSGFLSSHGTNLMKSFKIVAAFFLCIHVQFSLVWWHVSKTIILIPATDVSTNKLLLMTTCQQHFIGYGRCRRQVWMYFENALQYNKFVCKKIKLIRNFLIELY